MRFCFIILCHLYLLSRLPFSRVIHSERIFHSTAVLFPLYFKVNALPMSLNLNAALSSFIAASPRIIHHSKTRHWKKKKKTSTDLSRNQNTICVNPVFAGRFVYGPTNTWMGHICFYLFTLRYSSPPFVTSAAPSSVLRWRRLWSWVCCFKWIKNIQCEQYSLIHKQLTHMRWFF